MNVVKLMEHKLRLRRKGLEWSNEKAEWFISKKHDYIDTVPAWLLKEEKQDWEKSFLFSLKDFSCVLYYPTCFLFQFLFFQIHKVNV